MHVHLDPQSNPHLTKKKVSYITVVQHPRASSSSFRVNDIVPNQGELYQFNTQGLEVLCKFHFIKSHPRAYNTGSKLIFIKPSQGLQYWFKVDNIKPSQGLQYWFKVDNYKAIPGLTVLV
ncbi:hypothetical protein BSL78_08394 [Apostichopus japonicus]|uniref:Uncharacterized protein n=1 Tax=Stichopus japonicus TaxID=307972 RepID=A0A2G8L361_STIJA|nr:hypothetical protein BSL78_08394 [Apostichopus japonicus]